MLCLRLGPAMPQFSSANYVPQVNGSATPQVSSATLCLRLGHAVPQVSWATPCLRLSHAVPQVSSAMACPSWYHGNVIHPSAEEHVYPRVRARETFDPCS